MQRFSTLLSRSLSAATLGIVLAIVTTLAAALLFVERLDARPYCDPAVCTCPSPILVDTTGGGFQLTSAQDGVAFDILANGTPIHISWTAADSGVAFLALDRDGNGIIDSGKELFGNVSPQSPSPAPNGFLALEQFDRPEEGGNNDGVIDSKDAVYSKLLLWIDKNHDGISQPDELHTLSELGLRTISLQWREARRLDQFGNMFRYRTKVSTDNPKLSRWAYDVYFTAE